jgi:intein/homing endonuclease
VDLETLFQPENRLLLEDIKTLGGVKFTNKVNTLEAASKLNLLEGSSILTLNKWKKSSQKRNKIRKVSYFPDREDKVRVIAVLDY